MSVRMKLFGPILVLVLFGYDGANGLGQQPQNPDQGQGPGANGPHPFGRGPRRGPGPGGPGMAGFLRELNLTDDQRKQIREITGQNMDSTKSQREGLRQLAEKRFQGTLTADEEGRARTLRQQLQESMKDSEAKIQAVLTPEQKAKLEELAKDRRANHERFGRRRGFPNPSKRPGPPEPPSSKPLIES